ncbi:ParD-like family protein [Gilvimarinus agarilyticus]|uniref:ParD-like family protein n=1 Tax=unclassified Gilvimarinus TaxID=2642066 RepID=UPI001C082A0F|nr:MULTISPECIES: ParD-like family protein [unclassified Gilvimarinus]MBU2884979.1 ParD-like family protein [Gilvimarinus agarilyticus]MDO6569876.1 ParD-like family protein [Gilvimarinus sp. 2_MG-2023]MDO6747089.1 ParD-like family protein [Gilvimarinus sp. 1_MG-2023]
MGIVKISDQMHDHLRSASQVMERSINAQAEFWMKIGRQAERNPTQTFSEIIQRALQAQEQQNHE